MTTAYSTVSQFLPASLTKTKVEKIIRIGRLKSIFEGIMAFTFILNVEHENYEGKIEKKNRFLI